MSKRKRPLFVASFAFSRPPISFRHRVAASQSKKVPRSLDRNNLISRPHQENKARPTRVKISNKDPRGRPSPKRNCRTGMRKKGRSESRSSSHSSSTDKEFDVSSERGEEVSPARSPYRTWTGHLLQCFLTFVGLQITCISSPCLPLLNSNQGLRSPLHTCTV